MPLVLIHQAAYFKVCSECGEHGVIIFPYGSRTPIIASKEFGFNTAENLLISGHLSEEEVVHIKYQIDQSALNEYITERDEEWALAESLLLDKHGSYHKNEGRSGSRSFDADRNFHPFDGQRSRTLH